jgi:predicted nuclease of predicted toxin-antitoxin system
VKLKLDENLGSAVAQILVEAGHDVSTVVLENLSGAVDRTVIDACQREGRCLVTLDLDFGNPLLFRHS